MDYKKLLKKGVPASLWRRGFAYLIDICIVTFIIAYPLQKLIESYGEQDTFMETFTYIQSHPSVALQLLLLSFSFALITILYWAILEYKINQTVGKLLFGIQVVSTTKTNTFAQYFMRNLSKFSSFLLLLDLLYLLFKGGNQRYLEKVSKTEVVVGGNNG